MSDTAQPDKTTAEDFLRPVAEGDIAPEHRAWMDAMIRETLDKKARGDMTYKSLDEIRRKFGFDAR